MESPENAQKRRPALPGWFLACLAITALLIAGSTWYTATSGDRTRARNAEYVEEREANGCDAVGLRDMAKDPDC